MPETETQEYFPDDLVTVGQYRKPRQANDDTLLILSMGHAYWMIPVESGYEVRVEAAVAGEVIRQLQRSRRENRFWPKATWRISDVDADAAAGVSNTMSPWVFVPYLIVLSATYVAQLQWSESFTDAGRLDVAAVWHRHEWWRLLTALTLHADASHLFGNLGFGCFFALWVAQTFGARLAWGLMLTGGALGNLGNVWLHAGENYYSIGASTAVFSAVGILAGSAFSEMIKHRSLLQLRDLLVPIFVAMVVLAWWGSSGENTDLTGHLMGLLMGLFLGAVARFFLWIP